MAKIKIKRLPKRIKTIKQMKKFARTKKGHRWAGFSN